MSVFAVGFVGRPVGGLVFAHFGDRIGRKPMMVVTMSLIGIASTLMGCIPSYASIGMAAPILLVLLRFLQGCALGGESTGAPILTDLSAQDYSRLRLGGFEPAGLVAAMPEIYHGAC